MLCVGLRILEPGGRQIRRGPAAEVGIVDRGGGLGAAGLHLRGLPAAGDPAGGILLRKAVPSAGVARSDPRWVRMSDAGEGTVAARALPAGLVEPGGAGGIGGVYVQVVQRVCGGVRRKA